jgi:tetratricopeptide (TPR) repeat protein
MSPEPIGLRPEVEAILREVAAQPGSSLLRASREQAPRAFLAASAEVAGNESWLSRAERHLAAVHREEVAHALRQAAWFRLANAGSGRERMNTVLSATRAIPVPARRDVASQAGRALQSAAWIDVGFDVQELLEALVRPESAVAASPLALLQAAHRLVPNVRARVLAGSALAITQRRSAALEVLSAAVTSTLPDEQLAVAWSNLADVLDELDRPEDALRAASRGLALSPDLVPGLSGALWYALRCGRPAVAIAHARELDRACEQDAAAIREVERRWTEMRAVVTHRLGSDGRQALQTVAPEVGAGTRRLIDALS